MIELSKEVKLDGSIETPQVINKIVFIGGTEVYYDQFVTKYTEYIDPKDLEIKRLLAVIQGLEEPVKKVRKKRRVLGVGEIKEIKVLLQLNTDVTEIATEYQCSTSAIYRIKKLLIEETIKTITRS